MLRVRSSKIRLVALLSIFAALIFAGSYRHVPEGHYQGRTSSDWLREVLSPDGKQLEAIAAFNEMGTNAEPVLMNALVAKPPIVPRIYRAVYNYLPSFAQSFLYKTEDPDLSRMAAVVICQHSTCAPLLADLYPLLETPNSAYRMAVLQSLKNATPDTNQLHYFVTAGADPDVIVSREAWQHLVNLGPAGKSIAPLVTRICNESTNLEIRHDAAWTLWNMTGQSNVPLPILEQVMKTSNDPDQINVVAHDLLLMGDKSPVFIACLIHSLTNGESADKAIACSYLGQIGPPASNAVPVLRQALNDKAPEVRRRADVALSAIEAKSAAK